MKRQNIAERRQRFLRGAIEGMEELDAWKTYVSLLAAALLEFRGRSVTVFVRDVSGQVVRRQMQQLGDSATYFDRSTRAFYSHGPLREADTVPVRRILERRDRNNLVLNMYFFQSVRLAGQH